MLVHAITSWKNCIKGGFITQFQFKPCLIKIFQILKARVYKLCNAYITYKQAFADKRHLKRLRSTQVCTSSY